MALQPHWQSDPPMTFKFRTERGSFRVQGRYNRWFLAMWSETNLVYFNLTVQPFESYYEAVKAIEKLVEAKWHEQ